MVSRNGYRTRYKTQNYEMRKRTILNHNIVGSSLAIEILNVSLAITHFVDIYFFSWLVCANKYNQIAYMNFNYLLF